MLRTCGRLHHVAHSKCKPVGEHEWQLPNAAASLQLEGRLHFFHVAMVTLQRSLGSCYILNQLDTPDAGKEGVDIQEQWLY